MPPEVNICQLKQSTDIEIRTYGVTKIYLNNQEAKVKTCAGYSDDDNCDTVVPVHGNSQEHEEHAKLEAQDARDIAVGSGN